jgi:tellurite resistance protein
VRLRFALSWWAYSFPVAALTTATAVYGEATGSAFLKAGFVALYVVLAAVMTLLALLTIRALARGDILRPES